MPRHVASLALLGLLIGGAPPGAVQGTAARGHAPVCRVASHDRLILQGGRDVCAPTLNRNGRPTAAGFMPTECPRSIDIYTIDAFGVADRCLSRAPKEK